MYNLTLDDIIFLMFYASVAILSLMASCYLLFRRANAIAPDVMSPLRLRRWTPLWPVAVMVAPLVLGMAWRVVTRSDALQPVLFAYFLLMWLGLIIYMVRAIRQYGRWLRDNYADLEQKEVWQGFVVLAIFFLVEVINFVLICYLLWRVETLSDLSLPINDAEDLNVSDKRERGISPGEKYSLSKNIGSLLQQHCIDQQLYLQHDLTLLQLAKAIGTNRFYLSQYFSNQGTTYNAYINDLRINHFVSLYREKRSSSAQQLAQESGYRSYRTFSEAFKRKMGHTVSAWIKAQNEG